MVVKWAEAGGKGSSGPAGRYGSTDEQPARANKQEQQPRPRRRIPDLGLTPLDLYTNENRYMRGGRCTGAVLRRSLISIVLLLLFQFGVALVDCRSSFSQQHAPSAFVVVARTYHYLDQSILTDNICMGINNSRHESCHCTHSNRSTPL